MEFRLRRSALTLAVLAMFAVAVQAADRPPSSLHLVGDHWTAWNPPETLPPDSKIHVVAPGDTLWALSQSYLGNPYLWPQIWEKNQYVLDAHWIYPGDPLVVGVEVTPASEAVAESAPAPAAEAGGGDDAATRSQLRADSAEARRNTPQPLGGANDIYCSGFIAEQAEELPWGISGTEYDELVPRINAAQNWNVGSGVFGRLETMKLKLSLGDVVYLDSGRSAGLSPGMVLLAVEPRGMVRDPETRDRVGEFNAYLGRVRVLTALDDRAIGEIVQSCEGLTVGARLKAWVQEPVPLVRRPLQRPVNDPSQNDLSSAPKIVYATQEVFNMGEDNVVFIDRGESDDVFPGDVFTIYRTARNAGGPPVPVGELGILSVQPHSATAKIIEARYPVYLGDRLERH